MGTQGPATSFRVFVGLLPYVAGGCIVLITRRVLQIAIIGILITLFCTIGAYFIRKLADGEYAAQRLIIDPFLYGFEFAFAAVLVHYMLAGGR